MFPTKVYIALGSNIGHKIFHLRQAIKELRNYGIVSKFGNIYISEPYGFKDQQQFYNTAIEYITNLQPIELMEKIKSLETKLKKNKTIENGPRKIDMDIIFFGKQKFNVSGVSIPHPRAHLRDFVLLPIADMNKNFIHPTKKKSIKNLLLDLKENFVFKKLSYRNLR